MLAPECVSYHLINDLVLFDRLVLQFECLQHAFKYSQFLIVVGYVLANLDNCLRIVLEHLFEQNESRF